MPASPTRPDGASPEPLMLAQFLDAQREVVLRKAEGLTREQLAQTHPPSTLTLGGLLNHMALVEEGWLRDRFLGLPEEEPWASVDWEHDPDWEFRTAAELEPDELRGRYLRAIARSDEVVAAATGLDQLSVLPLRRGGHFSLRWVLLHLVEETARHAGHADLIREAIDGETGR